MNSRIVRIPTRSKTNGQDTRHIISSCGLAIDQHSHPPLGMVEIYVVDLPADWVIRDHSRYGRQGFILVNPQGLPVLSYGYNHHRGYPTSGFVKKISLTGQLATMIRWKIS